MSDVPPEVLVNILSRLPVKSLLRFRCVSKPWCTLIDSTYFIKLHLNQSVKTNTNLNIMFGGYNILYSLDLDSPKNVVVKIDNPLKCGDKYGIVVLGCCNGLLCLSTTESNNRMALWNALTHKYKEIPLKPIEFEVGSVRRFCIEGFGYDEVNDDYKVVRVIQSCGVNYDFVESTVDVYSVKSKSKSWRRVRDFPYYICYQPGYSAFAGGALHWIVSLKPEPNIDYLIAAFDLETEEYRLVPQPEYSDENFKISLAVLGGCLSVVCSHYKGYADIWVMKNYRVKESWVKLISIPYLNVYMRPVAYSKSGGEVLLEEDHEKLVWYDLVKKTAKKFRVHGMPEFFATDVYLGSLVWVDSDGAREKDAKKEERKEKKKNTKRRDDFLSKGFKLVL